MKRITVDRKVWVLNKKTSYMQRILDLARNGWQYHAKGEIPLENFFSFHERINRLCQVCATKNEVYKSKKAGLPTGRILYYHNPNNPQVIHFCLLMWVQSKADLPSYCPDSSGKWRPTYDSISRLSYGGYEVVRKQKAAPRQPNQRDIAKGRQPNARPIFTWQIPKSKYEEIRDQLIHALKIGDDIELRKILDTLFKAPGFAGVRLQVLAIRKLFLDSWSRYRGNIKRYICVPDANRVGYLSRISSNGHYLTKDAVNKFRKMNNIENLYTQ